MTTLAQRFIDGSGAPVELDGRIVIQMYRRIVEPKERFKLTFVRARSSPVQGACIKLKTGKIDIAEQLLAEPVLWLDTAPPTVDFACANRKQSELRIWNCWRDDNDVMNAWTGNAGLIVDEQADGRVLLRCNSRLELTFEDLILELTRIA